MLTLSMLSCAKIDRESDELLREDLIGSSFGG